MTWIWDNAEKLGALVTAISFFAIAWNVWFALRQFRRTLRHYNDELELAHYSQLDQSYNSLLALVIAHPFFRSPAQQTDESVLNGEYEPFTDPQQRAAYDAYAHLVWCFIESIWDRCQDLEDPKALMTTWRTAISVENSIHRGWLINSLRNEEILRRNGEPLGLFTRPFFVFAFERQWRGDDWSARADYANPPPIKFPQQNTGPPPQQGKPT